MRKMKEEPQFSFRLRMRSLEERFLTPGFEC